jgi:regulator of sigma E protease
MVKEAARTPGKKKVILTVRRESNHQKETHTLKAVEWEERWDNDREIPITLSSPLAIPQLGLAYWVLSQIVAVDADSPAAAARREKDDTAMPLHKEDTIEEMRVKRLSPYQKEPVWGNWSELHSKRDGDTRYDCWAQVFRELQLNDFKEIQVKVNRPGEEIKDAIALTGREDPSWPLVSRGIRLQSDYELQKAGNFGEALVMGGRASRDMIAVMYLQLRSLLTGRISSKQMGGPFAIMTQGFLFAQSGNYELLLFLAMISINLAVVNFLPIPILDGGHMVFLIYEKLRGRPPTEKVRAIGTYIGLAMIVLLMIFVFYQDFQNYLRKMLGI